MNLLNFALITLGSLALLGCDENGADPVVAASPTKISIEAFDSSSKYVVDCQQTLVRFANDSSDQMSLDKDRIFSFSSSDPNAVFRAGADPACGQADTVTFAVASGDNLIRLGYVGTLTGDSTITITDTTTDSPLTAGTTKITLLSKAERLLWNVSSASIPKETCQELGLDIKNGPPGVETVVTLSATAGFFYSDAACQLPVATVTFAPTVSAKTLYYASLSQSSAVTLNAEASGLTSGSQVISVY